MTWKWRWTVRKLPLFGLVSFTRVELPFSCGRSRFHYWPMLAWWLWPVLCQTFIVADRMWHYGKLIPRRTLVLTTHVAVNMFSRWFMAVCWELFQCLWPAAGFFREGTACSQRTGLQTICKPQGKRKRNGWVELNRNRMKKRKNEIREKTKERQRGKEEGE